MRALSIRQPYAELILRGIKTVELRSISTNIIGERFYIYAALRQAQDWCKTKLWSDDLQVATPPTWMIELAKQMKLIEPELRRGMILPRGVIVGSAVIEGCEEVRDQKSEVSKMPGLTSDLRPLTSMYAWQLSNVKRLSRPRKPTGRPQPVWFNPFD